MAIQRSAPIISCRYMYVQALLCPMVEVGFSTHGHCTSDLHLPLYLSGSSQTCTYIHNPTSRTYPTLALWKVNPPNVDQVCLIHQIVLTGATPHGVNGLTVGILHLYLLKLKTTKTEPITTLYTIIIQCSTVIRFFPSSKISLKKYSCKIIFGQTKLNENNFTSRMWCALIEEITPCAEEMAGEKQIVCCVRCYHVYGQQQFGKCWCVARSQPTLENFCCKIIFT